MEGGFLDKKNIFNEQLTCLEDWRMGKNTIFFAVKNFGLLCNLLTVYLYWLVKFIT